MENIDGYEKLEKILDDTDWKDFENLVGEVFRIHDYDVEVSKVVTFENTKRQYDVIGEKDHTIIVDCKYWDNKRRVKHGLKEAVKDQIERTKRLTEYSKKYPMIVTSKNVPIKFSKKVPIIPVSKLSEFLNSFEVHKDAILKI